MSARLTTATLHAAFSPLDGAGRVGSVTQRLEDAIRLGLLADGERLPSESELASHLGVSTVTLREALASLRGRGLVRTQRGRGGGTFVHSPEHLVRTRLHEQLAELTVHEIRDLGDERSAVAGAIARLAAERASARDVAALERHLSRLRAAGTLRDRRRSDGWFHVELAAAAQSARLTRAEIALQREIGDLLWLSRNEDERHASALTCHASIVDAVRDHEPSLAHEVAVEHVALETADLVAMRMSLATA